MRPDQINFIADNALGGPPLWADVTDVADNRRPPGGPMALLADKVAAQDRADYRQLLQQVQSRSRMTRAEIAQFRRIQQGLGDVPDPELYAGDLGGIVDRLARRHRLQGRRRRVRPGTWTRTAENAWRGRTWQGLSGVAEMELGEPDVDNQLGLVIQSHGVHIDTKSPKAHINERLARAAPLKAAAIAGDNAAWEQLWLASSRPLPIRPVASVPSVMGAGFRGWPRVTAQLTAMLKEIEKSRLGNQTQTPGAPVFPAGPATSFPTGAALPPGTQVELPGAGTVTIPPILQGGGSPSGPNAMPLPGYGPVPDYAPAAPAGGGNGGAGPSLSSLIPGGNVGLVLGAVGLGLTVLQLLSDRSRGR